MLYLVEVHTYLLLNDCIVHISLYYLYYLKTVIMYRLFTGASSVYESKWFGFNECCGRNEESAHEQHRAQPVRTLTLRSLKYIEHRVPYIMVMSANSDSLTLGYILTTLGYILKMTYIQTGHSFNQGTNVAKV